MSNPHSTAPGRRAALTIIMMIVQLVALWHFAGPVHAPSSPFLFSDFAAIVQPTGVAYSSVLNKLIVSSGQTQGITYPGLFQVDASRNIASFAPRLNHTDEAYLAVSPGLGGFVNGTIFAGTGPTNSIAKISPDGSSVIQSWTTCPGAGVYGSGGGAFRGGLTFDRTGSFGNNLLALSSNGILFRVNSTGTCTTVANLSGLPGGSCCSLTEGVTVAPLSFGPFGGNALLGSVGRVTAVSAAGSISTLVSLGNGLEIENLNFVPSTPQSFFVGMLIDNNLLDRVRMAPASQFSSADVGTLIASQEYPFAGSNQANIYQVSFNATSSSYTQATIASGLTDMEGAAFAPILTPPPFDFSLTNSGNIITGQGGSGSNSIAATLVTGTTQSISLSCSGGLPSGAFCSFNPASSSPSFSSTLTISTMSSTQLGSYVVNVTGSGGGQTHLTQFTLTVQLYPSAPFGPGTVCLNDPAHAPPAPGDPCPSTPFVFDGPYPSTPQIAPTQIRVGVYVNRSASMDGFDVTVLADHTILKPASVDLTGSVLSQGGAQVATLLECLGGNLISGTVCSSIDTSDTIHLAAITFPGHNTYPPTTGLLFTAIYNITGVSPSNGVPIGFQTGCTNTSVGGGVCITIAYAPSVTPDQETVQTGTSFNNSACLSQCSWFAITSNVTSATFLNSNTGNHVLITATQPNGGPILGSIGVTFATTASPSGLNVFFNATTCSPSTFNPNDSCSVTATISAPTAGTYSLTVYGSYEGDNCAGIGPCTASYTLAGLLLIQVNVQGISWTVNSRAFGVSQTLYFAKGTFSIPYSFQSIAGYSGTITLSTSICSAGTTGVACPVPIPPAFPLAAGQSITKSVNFTATGYGRLVYRDTLAATGLQNMVQGTDAILISGFSMTPNSTNVSFKGGAATGHVGVTLASLGVSTSRFAGIVLIGSTVSPTGLTITCGPPSVTLAAGGTGTTTCSFTSMMLGTCSVTITGAGTSISNQTATITVNVLPSIIIKSSSLFLGLNVTTSGGLAVNSTASIVAGIVTVTGTNATTTQLVSKNNYTITGVSIQNTPLGQTIVFLLNIPVNPYPLSSDITIMIGQSSTQIIVTVTREIAISGSNTVGITDVTFVSHYFNCVVGQPGCDPRADIANRGIVDIIDATDADSFFNAPVFY